MHYTLRPTVSTTNLAAGPDFDFHEATAAEGFGDKNVGGAAWSVRFESLYSPTHDAEHTFRAHVIIQRVVSSSMAQMS